MKSDSASVYYKLQAIHSKHSRRYRGNSGTNQMCCMWSTYNPPEIIEGTKPIHDIEKAFGIEISDDEALELYDMNLDEAAKKIVQIQENQNIAPQSDSPAPSSTSQSDAAMTSSRRKSAKRNRELKRVQPVSFDTYPNLARWVKEFGWLEIGYQEVTNSFIRAIEPGGALWKGRLSYPTLDAALADADAGVARLIASVE